MQNCFNPAYKYLSFTINVEFYLRCKFCRSIFVLSMTVVEINKIMEVQCQYSNMKCFWISVPVWSWSKSLHDNNQLLWDRDVKGRQIQVASHMRKVVSRRFGITGKSRGLWSSPWSGRILWGFYKHFISFIIIPS